MDKNDQLRGVIGRLAGEQAIKLAHALEMQRALGQESLPTELLLEGLRPQLRVARPPRVPTLSRLVIGALEEFLSDQTVEGRREEGRIPRAALRPWWTAMRKIAGEEMTALEGQLRRHLAENSGSLDGLRSEALDAGARWTAALVAELDLPKSGTDIKKILRGPLADDARAIAHILPLARTVAASMKALTRLLTLLNVLEGRRIVDLPPDAITLLKQHYLKFSEMHGTDARFLALAVLNRLDQPRQILRLGRALSWKANDALVANTEFSSLGLRLIGDVDRLAENILAQIPRRGPLPPAEKLGQAILHYLDESEGLLGEIGVRRDSPWGVAIMKTRATIAETIDADLLDRYVESVRALVPETRPGRPDLSAKPTPEASLAALQCARFLQLLVLRGLRHGLAKPARETIDALGSELETRVDAAIAEAAETRDFAPAVEAQVSAVAQVCDVLFNDKRGDQMLRRMTSALRAASA